MIKLKALNLKRAMQNGYKWKLHQLIIALRSWPWIHTELQFSDRYDNISYSCTLMDKSKGARFKNIKYSHPERWDEIIIPTTKAEEDLVYAKAWSKVNNGIKYDLFGLLSFATPLEVIRPSRNREWCSESCCSCLDVLNHFHKNLIYTGTKIEIDPTELYLFTKRFYI